MNPSWAENINVRTEGTFIKCMNCKHEARIYDPQYVEIFFCPKCRCIHSKNKSDYNKIAKNKKPTFEPIIPLYSKATIEGVQYTTISAVLKHEKGFKFERWEEYTLMSDAGVFVYLSHYNGHWTMLEEWPEPKEFKPDAEQFVGDDGEIYEHYSTYQPITINAVGEFSEDIIDNKYRKIYEFINPPFIFSIEADGKDRITYAGEYLRQKKLVKLFPDVGLASPPRIGVGNCQPFYLGIDPPRFLRLSIIFMICTIPFYIILSPPSGVKSLALLETTLTDSVRTRELVSPTFDVKGSLSQVLRLELYSSIENDWVSADIGLVNEVTGEEKSFFHDLEYYHGYDEDGSWSEGDPKRTSHLNSIEPGKYHIEANISGSGTNKPTIYRLEVYPDRPTSINYLVLLGLLAIICALLMFADKKFEESRYGITGYDDEDE
jgi:hypothetical protein